MTHVIQLPQPEPINETNTPKLNTLLIIFPPHELEAFWNKHQLEMHLHTPEDIELRDAISTLLQLLSHQS